MVSSADVLHLDRSDERHHDLFHQSAQSTDLSARSWFQVRILLHTWRSVSPLPAAAASAPGLDSETSPLGRACPWTWSPGGQRDESNPRLRRLDRTGRSLTGLRTSARFGPCSGTSRDLFKRQVALLQVQNLCQVADELGVCLSVCRRRCDGHVHRLRRNTCRRRTGSGPVRSSFTRRRDGPVMLLSLEPGLAYTAMVTAPVLSRVTGPEPGV